MNEVTHCAGLRVLVVDDHLASRLYTVAALRQTGAAVKAVGDAEEALVTAMSWRPDVLITDLQLPGISGHELVRRIRRDWAGKRLPRMILLSADASSRDGPGTAADEILAKPANPAQLRAALHDNSTRRIGARTGQPNEAGRTGAVAAGADRVMEETGETSPDELQALFRQELAAELPSLETLLAGRDLKGACVIVHRLLASSRLCGARRLELCLHTLYRACLSDAQAIDIARGYYGLLAAAGAYLAAPAPRRMQFSG